MLVANSLIIIIWNSFPHKCWLWPFFFKYSSRFFQSSANALFLRIFNCDFHSITFFPLPYTYTEQHSSLQDKIWHFRRKITIVIFSFFFFYISIMSRRLFEKRLLFVATYTHKEKNNSRIIWKIFYQWRTLY